MIISKVINNNVVSTQDEKGRELILMGSGLGFQKKPGEEIVEEKVEKKFRLHSKEEFNQFVELIEDMPLEHLRISSEIISFAKNELDMKLSRSIYITLTDHLNFAIERQKSGIEFTNPLYWEIQKFYKDEFRIGCKALEMVKDSLGIELSRDESASIAMHFVNAEMENPNMHETIKTTKLIQNAMNIIRFHFNTRMDTEHVQYSRFVTHLKYLAHRIYTGMVIENEDHTVFQAMAQAYPEDLKCADKIGIYIREEFSYSITEEEKLYLLIHINRIRQS